MTEATGRRYAAIQTDRGRNPRKLGEVSLDAAGFLAVLAAEPGQGEMLARVVKDMNNSKTLGVKIPPEGGAPQFATASRRVSRDDPEFASVLRAQLQMYYDVELQPG